MRFSLPDMARFEVEANWVRTAGLATLGAAEAMSLEAAKRADILMVGLGEEEESTTRRGEHATLTHKKRKRYWRVGFGGSDKEEGEKCEKGRREQRGLVWKNCGDAGIGGVAQPGGGRVGKIFCPDQMPQDRNPPAKGEGVVNGAQALSVGETGDPEQVPVWGLPRAVIGGRGPRRSSGHLGWTRFTR